MFVDLFGGSGSVVLNVKAEHYIYNDIVPYVRDILEGISTENIDDIIAFVKSLISKHDLTKLNLDGFNELRSEYNNGFKDWKVLYTLMCYSFDNQYRFNNAHQYNSSFGKNRSSYTDTTESKLKLTYNKLNQMDITFMASNFKDFDFSDFDSNDFVYCDPPYLNSIGNYNDGKRGFEGWSNEYELELYNKLDQLHKQGCRFAVSNNISVNSSIKEWANKNGYTIHMLSNSYYNCCYNKKDKSNSDAEVLITNY